MDDMHWIHSTAEVDLTVDHPVYPSPRDWRDQVIYFLLIDRFDDGADHPPFDGVKQLPRDTRFGVPFQGGTLAGVTRRLDYLKGLGVTTLWLSPVFKNRVDQSNTFHGYAIQDFLAIDARIGTTDDLIHLVTEAHARGMYVILDIILNHTGDNWAYQGDTSPVYDHGGKQYDFGYWRATHPLEAFDHDDAVWPAELQSPDCYKRRGSIVNWFDVDEAINADFLNLKELDLNNPHVLETMQLVYKYWIKTTNIDGYRIDTVKHMEDSAAARFCTSIKEYAESIGKSNFFLFGEVVADDDTVKRYVGSREEGGDVLKALDAALDFPLYFVLEEVIKGFANPQLLRDRYARLRHLYASSEAGDRFVTFLDNHDQMVRPFRRFLHGVSDERQVILGLGYLLTTPGIPAIYYGTEQGFDGGAPPGPWNDVAVRENMFGGDWGAFGTTGMHFFNQEHALYRAVQAIGAIRRETPALRYGRLYFREVSEDGRNYGFPAIGWGILAYSRILDQSEIIVALNLRDTPYENFVTCDYALTPPGTLLIDLLDPSYSTLVEDRANRAVCAVAVDPHGLRILSIKTSSIS